jgi:hypothetical protein
MGLARCQSIFDFGSWEAASARSTALAALLLGGGTIMAKSLLTGIAICTMLAIFAGNANAYKARAHKTHKTTTTLTTGAQSSRLPNGIRVNTGPRGDDPLYKSCDAPWKYPAYQCPNDSGGP